MANGCAAKSEMNASNSLVDRIRAAFEQQALHERKVEDWRSHKYEYVSYGLTAPAFYRIVRSHKEEIEQLSKQALKRTAMELAKVGVEEMTQAGIELLRIRLRLLDDTDLAFVDSFARKLNSWSTVDAFAVRIVQPLLLKYPELVLERLRKWNTSKDLWQRRLSVVPFEGKIGASGRFTKQGLEMCENIIHAEEDLVRKGIGWALKDMMRGDKATVVRYVKDLRRRGVSSTITLYAIRDLSNEERQSILSIK